MPSISRAPCAVHVSEELFEHAAVVSVFGGEVPESLFIALVDDGIEVCPFDINQIDLNTVMRLRIQSGPGDPVSVIARLRTVLEALSSGAEANKDWLDWFIAIS